jgi:hypothetical protein
VPRSPHEPARRQSRRPASEFFLAPTSYRYAARIRAALTFGAIISSRERDISPLPQNQVPRAWLYPCLPCRGRAPKKGTKVAAPPRFLACFAPLRETYPLFRQFSIAKDAGFRMHRAATKECRSRENYPAPRRKDRQAYPPVSAGHRVESPDDFRFFPRFPRTRRPGRRSRHVYMSLRHWEHHRLARSNHPTAAGAARRFASALENAENYVAGASQRNSRRDKILR